MKDATKVWDEGCEKDLDAMLLLIRKSIIADAEAYTQFLNEEKVGPKALEVALYKSIMTLNETIKAVIIKKLGPTDGVHIIQSYESRAMEDVSVSVFDEIMENYDNLPPELKSLMDEIKKAMKDKNKEK